MAMNRKIMVIFVSLFILMTGIAYAACDQNSAFSNNVSVGSHEYCVDAYGFTEQNVNPATVPPTIREGFQFNQLSDYTNTGEFKTEGEITLADGGKFSGAGTLNADGTIKLGAEAYAVTKNGLQVSGNDVTYNPDTSKTSFGADGGRMGAAVAGFTDELYFQNANDVELTNEGAIGGTCGENCLLPGGRVKNGGEFTIYPPNDLINGILVEVTGTPTLTGYATPLITADTGVPYSTPIFISGKLHFPGLVIYDAIDIQTKEGGTLYGFNGLAEIDPSGQVYGLDGDFEVNGVYVPYLDNEDRVALYATTGDDFDTSQDESYSIHFHEFSDSRNAVGVKNTKSGGEPLTAQVISDGYYGYEEGQVGEEGTPPKNPDDLRITAINGQVTLQERPSGEIPLANIMGDGRIKDDSHETISLNGKVYQNQVTGGDAVEMLVNFYDQAGNQLKNDIGNYYVKYNNVEAGDIDHLFRTNRVFGDWTSIFGDSGTCPAGGATSGSATSFLGKAWGWITGRQALGDCQVRVQAVQASNVYKKFSDISIDYHGISAQDVGQLDDVAPDICYVNINQNGKSIAAPALIVGTDKDEEVYVVPRGLSEDALVLRVNDNKLIGTISNKDMTTLVENTNQDAEAYKLLANRGSNGPVVIEADGQRYVSNDGSLSFHEVQSNGKIEWNSELSLSDMRGVNRKDYVIPQRNVPYFQVIGDPGRCIRPQYAGGTDWTCNPSLHGAVTTTQLTCDVTYTGGANSDSQELSATHVVVTDGFSYDCKPR